MWLTCAVLLFVFWYCYKRGKETRLEKERELTEQEVQRVEAEYKAKHPGEVYTTTAPPGASMEEVQAGIEEVSAARAARAAAASNPSTGAIEYKPSRLAHTKRGSTST